MSVIPCRKNEALGHQIVAFAETLKDEAHKLGDHGLDASEFYNSGLFRGAIERIRGQFAATMTEKRLFVNDVLSLMQKRGFISSFESAGGDNRHDYSVKLKSGKLAIVELKGCLDGNNTNIFARPPHAQEFVIWSVCANPGSDPQKNVWSGIHTRLSAEIISQSQRVDGLIVWDWVCGTIGRPCPKLDIKPQRKTAAGPYLVPPACIYVFPATVPSPRNNPHPLAQKLETVELLDAFHQCFQGHDDEVNYVEFEVSHKGAETVRRTVIRRAGRTVKVSGATPIRRE